jgi:phospholipase/carboxylesterase
MELLYTAHVPPGEGPFPTIVALHGWGANAHDLLGLAPYFHGGEALVLCPQGPVTVPVGEGVVGYGWFPLSGGAELDSSALTMAGLRLKTFLDQAFEVHPVDPKHLLIMGFSQGGVMAYDLVLRDPGSYTGLVAMSSWLPEEVAAGVEANAGGAALPILITHGTADPMIPVGRAQDSNERLRALGYAPIYREYDMQHELRPEALRDVVGFLDDKVLVPISLA